jgi:hypothetical protein
MRWSVLSFVFLLACGPSYPRLTIEKTGIGDEGGQSTFSIDAKGRFHRESRGDNGVGTIHWKKCNGSLDPDDVAAVFAEFERARLSGTEKQFKDPAQYSRERTTLTYAPSSSEALFPVDDAEFQRLDALVMNLRRAASSSDARCREGREKD